MAVETETMRLSEVMSNPVDSTQEIGGAMRLDDVIDTGPMVSDKAPLGFFRSVGIGVDERVSGIKGRIGGAMVLFGEAIAPKPTEADFIDRSKVLAPLTKRQKSFGYRIASLGQRWYWDNKDEIDKLNLPEREEGITKSNIGRDVGSGVVSLLEALAYARIGGPAAAGGAFAAEAGGQGTIEALQEGRPSKEAVRIGSALGIAEGSLEFIGIDKLLKITGGPVKRAIKGSLTEFLQEASQSTAGESIRLATGLREFEGAKSVWDVIGQAVYEGSIGAIVGGPTSVALGSSKMKEARQVLEDAGVDTMTARKIIETATKTGMDSAIKTLEKETPGALADQVEQDFVIPDFTQKVKGKSSTDQAEEFGVSLRGNTDAISKLQKETENISKQIEEFEKIENPSLEQMQMRMDMAVQKQLINEAIKEAKKPIGALTQTQELKKRLAADTAKGKVEKATGFKEVKKFLEERGAGEEALKRIDSLIEKSKLTPEEEQALVDEIMSSSIGIEASQPSGQTIDPDVLASALKKVEGIQQFELLKDAFEGKEITPEQGQKLIEQLEKIQLTPEEEQALTDSILSPSQPIEFEEIVNTVSKEASISKDNLRDFMDNKIKREIADFERKEGKRMSVLEKVKKQLSNARETKKLIESLPEFAENGKQIFEGKQELLSSLRDDIKYFQDRIKNLKPISKTVTEASILKSKIRNIKRGFRKGQSQGRREVKAVQGKIIDLLNSSGLNAQDKNKFISSIKNVQTIEQMEKAIPNIEARVDDLIRSESKRSLAKDIKKALKTTKPLKKGQKRVSKYDYQTNKIFEDLRSLNGLTKSEAQEQLDQLPDPIDTQSNLIKKRFLSLKANGADASVEVFEQVLADINQLKAIGERSKDKADFEAKLEKVERIEEAVDGIARIKANKKTIKTKIGNLYRKGFSNIYSMFNSIAGKDFAEKYNPESAENKMHTNIFYATKSATETALEIYDQKNFFEILESLSRQKFGITDVTGVREEITKHELLDIYNSIKNPLVRERYYNSFGKDQVDFLMGFLTTQDIRFADTLQDTLQEYREVFNKRNIEIEGRDLGFVENYWPATSEREIDIFDDIRVQGETPSAMRERSNSANVIPIPTNAWYKFQKHVSQAEHVKNLSREYETLIRIFRNKKVRSSIKEKFGKDVYNVLLDQIENISLNAHTQKIDSVSSAFKIVINNWVTAKVATPNVFVLVRQLISTGNYIERMNSADWVKDFAVGLSHPKKTFDFMWKNSKYLEARYNRGYSEALRDAIEGAENLNVVWGKWTKFLTTFGRAGDITAIIYGGYPLVQSELRKGKSLEEAIKIFEDETLRAQQSGLRSSLSQYQNSKNPFARLFLAFKNTANQYFRKMVDATMSYQNGDIGIQQYSKTMFIYLIAQPTLYASSGLLLKQLIATLAGNGEDSEEFQEALWFSIMNQIVLAPVNAIPVLDDVTEFATKKLTGQKVWKVFSTPVFSDLEDGLQTLMKEEPTAEDYLESAASILEPLTAAPIKTVIRLHDLIKDDF